MKKNGFFRSSLFYVITIILMASIGTWLFGNGGGQSVKELSTSELVAQLSEGNVKKIQFQLGSGAYQVTGEFVNPVTANNPTDNGLLTGLLGGSAQQVTKFKTRVLTNDSSVNEIRTLAQQKGTEFNTLEEDNSNAWVGILLTLVPYVVLFGLMYYMMNQLGGGAGGRGGNNPMNFGKSRADDSSKKQINVRFSDVAGAEEEKLELVEVVEFLRDPRKFTALGARIPAGVLLEGPPGTGKTLLAKAVAGEAKVPFYSISGSEFVEMFVGVGASRVRDLFDTAKKNAPAIIFIDEIDAVGRQRGAGMGGGHDEREQTLNQLLVEMDGFSGSEGIIVIAATNRSDVLDPALLRPGRFDRQVLVGNPDVKGREAVLKVHARNKPLAEDVDLKVLAQQTPGFSGADLENLLNESALIAARRNKTAIDASDIDEAHDRVIAGPSKRDRTLSDRKRRIVAFHEAGHTIAGLVLSDAQVVHKVTIVARGRAAGYAIMLPKEDQVILTRDELFEQVVGLLGGRAAEQLVFGLQTTGASNDFEQATRIVRGMVTQYGMSDKLGTVQYEGNHQVFIGRDYGQTKAYSEQLAFEIDTEVRHVIQTAYQKALEILETHREQLDLIAAKLLELETLDERTIKSLFETGQMPATAPEDPYPSEAASYDEMKQVLDGQKADVSDSETSEEPAEETTSAPTDEA